VKCDFDVGHGREKTPDSGGWQQAVLKTGCGEGGATTLLWSHDTLVVDADG
jgi:hypothetical protein